MIQNSNSLVVISVLCNDNGGHVGGTAVKTFIFDVKMMDGNIWVYKQIGLQSIPHVLIQVQSSVNKSYKFRSWWNALQSDLCVMHREP